MEETSFDKKVLLKRHAVEVASATQGVFQSRFGVWLLAMVSFVESALIVPIITDPFLVAYLLSNQTKVFTGWLVTTAASVFGGVVAYATAAFVIELVLTNSWFGVTQAELHNMTAQFEAGTFLVTILGAITPLPYTIVALGAGSIKANFLLFVLASVLGRGFRYAVVTYLTVRFGQQALVKMQQHFWLATTLAVLLIAAYVLYKFLL